MSDVTRCRWPRGLVPVDPVDPVDGHDLRVVPQDGFSRLMALRALRALHADFAVQDLCRGARARLDEL